MDRSRTTGDDTFSSMLGKLTTFAESLDEAERDALNHLGRLASGSCVGVAEHDVAGFAIISGTDPRVAGGSTHRTPNPGGSVPIPYPNVGALLGRTFPL